MNIVTAGGMHAEEYVGMVSDALSMRLGVLMARGLSHVCWNSPRKSNTYIDVYWLVDDGGLVIFAAEVVINACFTALLLPVINEVSQKMLNWYQSPAFSACLSG